MTDDPVKQATALIDADMRAALEGKPLTREALMAAADAAVARALDGLKDAPPVVHWRVDAEHDPVQRTLAVRITPQTRYGAMLMGAISREPGKLY